MSRGKSIAGTVAASLALLAFGQAAFVRVIPSSQAQDASRAWFSIGVLLACVVLFLIARRRSSY